MNSRLRIGCVLMVLSALLLSGCASGRRSYSSGVEAMKEQNYDLAVAELNKALQNDPGNVEYEARLAAARGQAAWGHLERGRLLRAERKFVEAASELRLAAVLSPTLDVAAAEFRQVQKYIKAQELASEAQENMHGRRLHKAERLAEEALEIDPDNELALTLISQLQVEEKARLGGFELDIESNKPVTLKFKDAKLQEVFKILNRLSGINFIFDEDLKGEQVTLLLEDATFSQALELLMKMNNLGSRVLNPKTVIIYSNTKDKQKQYEDQIIQTFYLSSIDAKKAVNMLRTMLQLRKIYVHEELNAVVVRDKPDVIELVSQILANADLADSEVVFDLELIEVSHGDLLNFGIEPSSYGASFVGVKNGDQISNSLPDSSLGNLIDDLTGIDVFFTLPSATFEMSKTLTDTVILATPKIRVKNREKAKVHVGTREPSITSTGSGSGDSGVYSTNVQYIDVGVKVDVEPVIQLDNTVRTKLRLEVSSVSDRQTVGGSTNPTTVFTISTTNAETALILKDGERTIIGGLIRNSDTKSKKTFPILGEIPLIGALFSKQTFEDGQREILLSVTPHIVKKVDVPSHLDSRIWSGGEEDLKAGANFAAFAQLPDPDEGAPIAPETAPGQEEKQPVVPVTEPTPEAGSVEESPADASGSPVTEPVEAPAAEPVTEPESEAVSTQTEPVSILPEGAVPIEPETPVEPGDQIAEVNVPPAEIKVPVLAAKLFLAGSKLVNAGEEFMVELQVAEVEELYSAPLFINYDSTLLDFVRADEGDFLRVAGQATVFTSSPNRSRGELIIGNKQGTGGDGASGSGVLARIYFKAKQAGNALIRPNRVNFRAPSGSRMMVEAEPFNIEIQ